MTICIGLSSRPRKNGEGGYMADFSVGVAAIVSAKDWDSTLSLAKQYAAASRAVMVQKPSCGGFACGVEWLDESYDDIPAADNRTLAAGMSMFVVSVDNVINRQGGPRTWPFPDPPDPGSQPGSHWPLVETVDVDVEKEAIT
jgi:hypothetical protein